MVTITLYCPHCGSDALGRDGHAPNSKQKCRCHCCGRRSREEAWFLISDQKAAHFLFLLTLPDQLLSCNTIGIVKRACGFIHEVRPHARFTCSSSTQQ